MKPLLISLAILTFSGCCRDQQAVDTTVNRYVLVGEAGAKIDAEIPRAVQRIEDAWDDHAKLQEACRQLLPMIEAWEEARAAYVSLGEPIKVLAEEPSWFEKIIKKLAPLAVEAAKKRLESKLQ